MRLCDACNQNSAARVGCHGTDTWSGRGCMVYSARTLRDAAKVALKVFKKGPTYDGAVQREQYILELFSDPKHNIGKFSEP